MNPDDPGFVVGAVGRLTEQKGYDMLFPVMHDLVNQGVRVIMLGSGDARTRLASLLLEQRPGALLGLRRLPGRPRAPHRGGHRRVPHAVALRAVRAQPALLARLRHAADRQAVGGLADTVTGYNGFNRWEASGFTFDEASPFALRDTIMWARHCYHDPILWTQLVRNGMVQDWSWHHSAEAYLAVYQRALQVRGNA